MGFGFFDECADVAGGKRIAGADRADNFCGEDGTLQKSFPVEIIGALFSVCDDDAFCSEVPKFCGEMMNFDGLFSGDSLRLLEVYEQNGCNFDEIE